MKKKLTKKIASVAIGIVAIFATLIVNAQNLLTVSPSFEDGSGSGSGSSLNGGSWSRSNASGDGILVQNILYRETTNPTAQDQTYYAKAVTPSVGGYDASYKLQATNSQNLTSTLINNKIYRVSFYYQNNANHTFKVSIENSDGTGTAGSIILMSSTAVTSWTFASFNFTLDKTVLTDGRLKLNFGADAGTTLVDNMKIEDVATLPVQLTYFTANLSNSSVQLNWETASELNSDRFEVMKSIDGHHFNLLKLVPAINKATKYNCQDNSPTSGTNYYKLMQYDKNEVATDYGIRTVNVGLKSQLAIIYPNPSHSQFNLQLSSKMQNKVTLAIISTEGKVVQKEVINTNSGVSNHIINLNEGLIPGIYTLQIKGNDLNENLRLSVQ